MIKKYIIFILACVLLLTPIAVHAQKKNGPGPATPVLLEPTNGATGVSAPVVLRWSSSNAQSADVYFGTTSSPPKIATVQTPTLASQVFTVTTLQPGTKYYWKVIVWLNGKSKASTTYSFTALSNTPPPPPDPSAHCTTVPPAPAIYDKSGNTWTILNRVILRNGVQAADGIGDQITYANDSIYVLNSSGEGSWWYWTGSVWIQTAGDPCNSTPPPPPPPSEALYFDAANASSVYHWVMDVENSTFTLVLRRSIGKPPLVGTPAVYSTPLPTELAPGAYKLYLYACPTAHMTDGCGPRSIGFDWVRP